MQPHTTEQIAHAWFDAFNAHSEDALLTLYADDAVHCSPKLKARKPETNGMIRGKDALLAWWRDVFERQPTMRFYPVTITASRERVFVEYRRTVDGEPEMLVAEVLEVQDGSIVASRVYHG